MTKHPFARITLFIVPLAAMTGCADFAVLKPQPDTTRFYFLESSFDAAAAPTGRDDGVAIVVGPSTVAKYLDQTQIVTLEGPNELVYSDLHRWGEPLEESVNRLLIYRLGHDLQTTRIGFTRMMGKFDFDYRIGYHIYELAGRVNGEVQLKVGWWITSRDGTISHYDGSVYSGKVHGNKFQDYVTAIQAVITTWADDISQTLSELAGQPRANSMSTSGSDPTSR